MLSAEIVLPHRGIFILCIEQSGAGGGYHSGLRLIVCLNEKMDESSDGLLHLLNVLLSIDMQPEKKASILNNIYDIAVDDSLGKELSVMCNLSEAIEERGVKRGLELGLEQGLRRGKESGEQRLSLLIKQLLADDRIEDIRKATENKAYREALYKKYSL